MSHSLVLLSPNPYPCQHPHTIGEDEMACWLNGYTLLWHPALLWKAAEPPTVAVPYDHDMPRERTIYIVPEAPMAYLPEDWPGRLKAVGSFAITAAVDRETTLVNLKTALTTDGVPDLAWPEALEAPADLLHVFFGVGLGYLMQATLAEAMEHENLLDKAGFWADVQKAVESLGSDDPAVVEATPTETAWLTHLRAAAEKLQSAREVLYPVTIHWLDLHLLRDNSLDGPLPAAVELGIPTNLIAASATLEALSRTQPEKFALLREQIGKDLVEVCGGLYREREEALLPVDSQMWNLLEGLAAARNVLGRDVKVFARETFGAYPRLAGELAALGVTKMLSIAQDDTAGAPTHSTPVVAWTAPDGKSVDSFVRMPKPADKADTFFNLGNTWFKTTREDHHATVCLRHAPGVPDAPWFRDLLALGRLAPVLGTWSTFSRYMSEVSAGEYPPSPTADDFHHDALADRTARHLTDPVTGFVKHLRNRRRIDACWTYAGLLRAIAGKADELNVEDALGGIERVFETDPALGIEPGGLTELETAIPAALAERLQSRAVADRPGYMLLNPCGFARRYALELDGFRAPLPVEGIVKSCQLDGSMLRAVVEVPALGFAWIPRTGVPGTAAMTSRIQSADPKAFTIRNEFFEAEIDPTTGGLKGIRDHKTLFNRIGQRLVFNPGSRMVAEKVTITSSGPALAEIVSEGTLIGEQDQELARFRQRFRAWLGRPLLEVRIELTPKQPPAGYPWHAYYGCRFGYRDERTQIYRGQGGVSHLTTHPRPQSPEFLDLRSGPLGTAIFPNGLPFHLKHENRTLDVILIPEGETTTTFDLGIALDRDTPILTAWGLASPLAVVPTAKGPPHVGASGWLFHLDLPSLLLMRLLPGRRETGSSPPDEGAEDAIVAELLECSGQYARCEMRCVRDPKRAVGLDGLGRRTMDQPITGDSISLDVAASDWMQVQIEF
jgi:hypothetical protein